MSFPTFSVVRHARTMKDGSSPVYLRLTYQRKKTFFSLGLSALPGDWDADAGRFRKTAPNAKQSNDILRTYEQRAADALLKIKRDGTAFSVDDFKRAVFAPSDPVLSMQVSDYAREVASELKENGQRRTGEIYDTLGDVLDGFGKYAVGDLSGTWLTRFEKYLRMVRGNTDGGVSVTMRTLRALCNRAVKDRGAPADWYPFKNYKMKRVARDAGSKALSLADFRLIESAIPANGGEFFALDMFRLSFYL